MPGATTDAVVLHATPLLFLETLVCYRKLLTVTALYPNSLVKKSKAGIMIGFLYGSIAGSLKQDILDFWMSIL